MRVSLFIIVVFLYAYATWVQKTAREVIAETEARELQLMERLGRSEKARIVAESALASAKEDREKLDSSAGKEKGPSSDTVAEGPPRPVHAGTPSPVMGM